MTIARPFPDSHLQQNLRDQPLVTESAAGTSAETAPDTGHQDSSQSLALAWTVLEAVKQELPTPAITVLDLLTSIRL